MIDEKGNEINLLATGRDWVAFGLKSNKESGYIVAEDDGSGWSIVSWFGPGTQYKDFDAIVESCCLV